MVNDITTVKKLLNKLRIHCTNLFDTLIVNDITFFLVFTSMTKASFFIQKILNQSKNEPIKDKIFIFGNMILMKSNIRLILDNTIYTVWQLKKDLFKLRAEY